MIGLAAAGAFLKPVGAFLKAIPWQVYAAAAVLLAGWWWGEQRYDAGVLAERDRWEEAQRKANEEAEAARAERDAAAAEANTAAAQQGAQAATETRTETATAVERVKHATRTIVVPGDCPVGLPDVVLEEGRTAVDRARAAGDPLRAGRDP